MLTTLDIEADVLAAAKELAQRQGVSAGKVVSGLLRSALTGRHQPSALVQRLWLDSAPLRPAINT